MISSIMGWLEHRAGIKKLVAAMLLEGVPGGAKWRYVWGSCLAFVLSIQLITGLLLMTAYSPSASQAWSSVHFIQYQMDFGWLIRGLHHFGSQTMMVLIALHMVQVVIAGAHLAPRELNWWLGIGLLGVTFGLSLTGYLLPWDQKGYWATRVATNIANNIPVLGPHIRQLVVGGPDYGNHTLTRFYALHVAILPGALIMLLIAHIAIFRRHGVTSKENVEGLVTKPENEHGAEPFYPRQVFYDMIACMVVFAVMMTMVMYGFGHKVTETRKADAPEPNLYQRWAKAGQKGLGADLDAAADRDTANYPARPEWYFLFLFQLLKYFDGPTVLVGTVIIPNGIMVVLTLLPLFGIGRMRTFGWWFSIVFVVALLAVAGLLTLFALRDDSPNGILGGMFKNTDEKSKAKADKFVHDREAAEVLAKRACQLAMDGTPVEGGHLLIRNDPYVSGRRLFEKNCGSCHTFSKRDGDKFESWIPKDLDGKIIATAGDLGDFASKDWIRGLLKDPMDVKYFGHIKDPADKAKHALTGMRNWRRGIDGAQERWKEAKDGDAKIATQEKDLDLIAEWLAHQREPLAKRIEMFEKYKPHQAAFFNKVNKCSSCHAIEKGDVDLDTKKIHFKVEGGGGDAPDLIGYGSAGWMRAMIMRPGHATRYGDKNLMPAFRNLEGTGSEFHLQEFREGNPNTKDGDIQHLSDVEREAIIRWMLRDYRPIYGGAPIR